MIRFCARCLYPETKPDLWFDDRGVCSACVGFESRKAVDWDDRKKQFTELTGRYRSKDGSNYDCIVPVSGGKDSTYQVIRLLQHGLNPLCVTATTDSLSDIGRRNLENIAKLGVDHIEVTMNPVVRRRLNKLALTEIGRTAEQTITYRAEVDPVFTIGPKVHGGSLQMVVAHAARLAGGGADRAQVQHPQEQGDVANAIHGHSQ